MIFRTGWLVVLFAVLAACSDEKDPPPDMPGPVVPEIDAYDAWREMLAVLRDSPDHSYARADRIAQTADPQAIFEYVRDEIAMLPPSPGSFFDAENAVRWGARATLRGGAGTPRERAELLRALLMRASIEAEVVVGRAMPGAEMLPYLGQSPVRTIDYSGAAEKLDRWSAAIGETVEAPDGPVTKADPNSTLRDAIVAKLRPLLTVPADSAAFDPTIDRVPLVRLRVDGELTYANPNIAGAQYGQTYTVEEPVPADPASGERSLMVRLEAARSDRPNERFLLAEKSWPASEVAGRTVTVAFTTPEPLFEAKKKAIGDASVFLPLILLRGEELDELAVQARSVIGEPFTLGGDLIESPGGPIAIGGREVASAPTNPALIESVATMTAEARSAAFPWIRVEVSARRQDGAGVPGMAADAFLLEENGEPVAAQLLQSVSAPPRLLMLFDRSTSIPAEFLDQAADVGNAIAAAIFAAHPDASIRVAGLGINGPDYAGPFATSAADVEAQLASLAGAGSEVWTNLAVAAEDRELTAVLLVSDFVPEDALTGELESRIFGGAPVLVAPVGMSDTSTAARIAELTQGEVLDSVTAQNLPASVRDFLDARRAANYLFAYRAPEAGAATRNVRVRLKAPSTAEAMATYERPSRRVAPDALSAIYLTIETDGRTVTRALAGSELGTPEDRDRVNAALFGRYVLSVEANAPSVSVLFDEHISERLLNEAKYDALKSGDAAKIARADGSTVFRVPADLRFMTAALPDEANTADLTYTDGLRVALHSNLPIFGEPVLSKLDLLPLAPYRTVTLAGGNDYVKTLERSATITAAETLRFDVSAWDLLKDEPLALFDPLAIDLQLGPEWREPAAAYRDYDLLAPIDGAPVAFFAVHRETGELIGVLADGSGGGYGRTIRAQEEDTMALIDRLLLILDVAKRAGEALGYEGVAAWADLEATKVNLLGSVILLFEGEGDDPTAGVLNSMCSDGLNRLAGEIPGFNAAMMPFGDLESLYRAMRVFFGAETPEIPGLDGPASSACMALFGG